MPLMVACRWSVTAGAQVQRGDELGMFAFGGSTVVLLLQPGVLQLDPDLLRRSAASLETLIRVKERVGTRAAK